jgi:hypothetical protein
MRNLDVASVFLPPVPVDPETAEALGYIARLEGVTPLMLIRRALRAWTTGYMIDLDGEPLIDDFGPFDD